MIPKKTNNPVIAGIKKGVPVKGSIKIVAKGGKRKVNIEKPAEEQQVNLIIPKLPELRKTILMGRQTSNIDAGD